jgi:glucose/arabinose dehydrogenase
MSGGMKAWMRIAVPAVCLLSLLGASRASAVGLAPVGTFSSPIYATAPAGDPRLFVVERGGTIQVLHDGTRTQFLDISALTTTDGERGLLSMAFDPNYASNGFFYVDYTGDGVDAGGALGDIHVDEFHVSGDPNVANQASRRTVLTFPHSASNHNGGQLQFGPDGGLYISVGDNANGANAQSLANFYGKLLRIDPHAAGAMPSIWSLGLRNPFRFSFDHLTGDLTIGDVGASSREEIDLSPASVGFGQGANFGWPNCEGFTGTCPGATAPVFDYPHSDPGPGLPFGCAIIGGFVYRGTQIPELSGRYLYTDLCTGDLRSIQLGLPLASDDRAETARGALANPNSFGQDASCELYVTNGNALDKIVGSGSSAAPGCQAAPAAAPTAQNCTTCPAGPTAKKCRHKKKRRRAAEAKHKHKKHKKRCKRKRHKKKAARVAV